MLFHSLLRIHVQPIFVEVYEHFVEPGTQFYYCKLFWWFIIIVYLLLWHIAGWLIYVKSQKDMSYDSCPWGAHSNREDRNINNYKVIRNVLLKGTLVA